MASRCWFGQGFRIKNMDITFKSVTKSYGLITALSKASFEVNKGDFVVITGPSGAGKSTIFKIILGQIRPTSGNVIINKQDLASIKRQDMDKIRKKIGVVFQDYQLIFDKTVEENLNLALDIIGTNQHNNIATIEKVLKTVDLLGRRYLFPSQLSGGELQRAALARAIVIKPDLILADEPMGNLDQKNSQKLIDLFEKINQQTGTTIVMATHNPFFINKLDHPKIEIESGKIISKPKSKPKITKKKKLKKTKNKQ